MQFKERQSTRLCGTIAPQEEVALKTQSEHYHSLLDEATGAILIDNLKLVAVRIQSHQLSYMHYRSLRRLLGFPRTLISGFLSSALSVNLFTPQPSEATSYVMFALAVSEFVLNLVLQYFMFTSKEKHHDMSVKLYTTLFRTVQMKLLKNNFSPGEKKELLQDMLGQLAILEQYEDVVPERFQNQAENDPDLFRRMKLDHLNL
jgi:uncharacterized protein YhhL (DUF1145 family)